MRFQNIVVSIAYKRDSETAKELHKKISIFNIILKFLEQMIVWHKALVEKTRIKLNLSYYQLYWVCFIKGVVVCYILMLFSK